MHLVQRRKGNAQSFWNLIMNLWLRKHMDLKDIKFMERKLDDVEESMKRSNDKQLKIEHECSEKSYEEKHDDKPYGEENEQDSFRDMAKHTMFEKGQSKCIWGELYKVVDSSEVVMQVPLFNILKKFDDEFVTEVVRPCVPRMMYHITRLPKYLILHMRRFTKNNFFVEKNPTLVNFPVKNLELKDYVTLPHARRMRSCDRSLILSRTLSMMGNQSKDVTESSSSVNPSYVLNCDIFGDRYCSTWRNSHELMMAEE